MPLVRFSPHIKLLKTLKPVDISQLKECFIKYAHVPDVQRSIPESLKNTLDDILKEAAPGYNYTSLDFKIQNLNKGSYPCTPGWHCDGDPNPSNGFKDRYCLLVSGNFCNTEFINEPIDLILPDKIDIGKLELLNQIQNQLKNMKFSTIQIPPWTLVEFDKKTLHQAVKSQEDGKRLLIRLNQSDIIKPRRIKGVTNE